MCQIINKIVSAVLKRIKLIDAQIFGNDKIVLYTMRFDFNQFYAGGNDTLY